MVLAQGAAEQLLHPDDDLVDVEELGAQELLAGEGEQLPGDVRGPGAGLDDLADLCAPGVVRLEAAEQELAEADDPGHHVVDFVRHAAGEPAGGLHPLRAAELVLDPFALGDVPIDPPEHRRARRPGTWR